MSRANAPTAFWRCQHCGTPNPRAGYLTHCVGCGTERPGGGSPVTTAPRRKRPDTRPIWRRWLERCTLLACWTYVAAMIGLIALMAVAGDRWWPTTFALFGPRWVAAIPFVVLLPMALIARRWATLPPILIASILVVSPWMGFRVPWGASSGGLLRLRFLTCNVEGGRAKGLAALIAETEPDLVILQECPLDWATRMFPGPGWFLHHNWGLAIASRLPIRGFEDRSLATPQWAGGEINRIVVETKVGAVDVFGVHLETPREGLESVIRGKLRGVPDLRANIAQRRRESQSASRWVGESNHPVLIAGDFNMPVDSTIYRESWSPYLNAFSAAGLGFGPTKFTRWFGVRIDHVLAGSGWVARRCWVGPDVGSDHRPVIADLDWDAPRD